MARVRKPIVKASVEFTLEELRMLDLILGNGWGDGDFKVFCQDQKEIQTSLRAMRKITETKERLVIRFNDKQKQQRTRNAEILQTETQ